MVSIPVNEPGVCDAQACQSLRGCRVTDMGWAAPACRESGGWVGDRGPSERDRQRFSWLLPPQEQQGLYRGWELLPLGRNQLPQHSEQLAVSLAASFSVDNPASPWTEGGWETIGPCLLKSGELK